MSTYTVIYERDEKGWWVATVKDVRGCHTQGRTIEQTRRRIREALSLFVADAEKATLVEDIKLPAGARNLVKQVWSTRQRAEAEQVKLNHSTALAVQVLTSDFGVSVRDAGELLGLSHQRVHQLTVCNEHPSSSSKSESGAVSAGKTSIRSNKKQSTRPKTASKSTSRGVTRPNANLQMAAKRYLKRKAR